MSRLKDVIHEIHRRSLWQVLGIYGAASWIALQVVGQLQESLELPSWVSGAAVVLLIVGLPIVLATAFVQEGTGTKDASGEKPASRPVESPDPARRAKPSLETADGTVTRTAPARPEDGVAFHRRVLSWRNALLGGAAAFLLMFGIAGLYVVIQDRGRAFAPDEALAVEAAPGIAVLPFNVTGPGSEFWREGMAQALALNLDGLAGLRTVDSRTVLSRWEDRVGEGDSPDLEVALEVARAAGGRYALLGDLVTVGSRTQAALVVYDVSTGDRLDRVQVEGSSAEDSTFAFVNRLTLEALRVLPRGDDEDVPHVDLARVTTDSIQALRAFLEGETHFRDEEYSPAIDAFSRAVRIDSTFALAHYRLSLAYGWRDNASTRDGHDEKAVQYSDRLSERIRLLARAHLAYSEGRAFDAYEQLEEATRKYPDEIEGWYLLGETNFHLGDQVLRDPRTSGRAFERVAQIDPTFMPGQQHRVEAAFARGDSAAVRRLLDLDWGDQGQIPYYRVAARLAWGSPDERRTALEGIDSLTPDSAFWVASVLDHPSQLELQETVVARVRSGSAEPVPAALLELSNGLRRGRVQEFAETLDRAPPGLAVPIAFATYFTEYPIADADVDRMLDASAELAPGGHRTLATAVLVDRGLDEEWSARLREMGGVVDSLRAEQPRTAERVEGHRRMLRAYRLWSRGDAPGAADSLIAAQRATTGWFADGLAHGVMRWWTAEALRAAGRDREAEPYYLSLSYGGALQAVAMERLAQLYDARGDLEKAAEYYAVFTQMWEDADPELQSRVEAARTRLEEILSERG